VAARKLAANSAHRLASSLIAERGGKV